MNELGTCSLLLVDDNPTDTELTREAIEQQGLPIAVRIAGDGRAAIAMLASFPDGELPKLMLLDINMPGVNGFDVLEYVRSRPELRAMPVIMLTTSSAPGDRARALAGGATDYLVKPRRFADLLALVDRLRPYFPGL